MKRVGLIVNPIAGMGGTVALKGTDGERILKKAIELGAERKAPGKMVRALEEIIPLKDEVEFLTCSGDMGENQAKALNFNYKVVFEIHDKITREDHTILAAERLLEEGVDLIIFAGGDGTARDVYKATKGKGVVIGVPAGVKIHSPVYAINPSMAGKLAADYISGRVVKVKEVEVMDIDEDAFRQNLVRTKLYGYLNIPDEERLCQNKKAPTPLSDKVAKESAAQYIIDNMVDDLVYILGPGSTTEPIMRNLGLENTLLGVDIIRNKKLVMNDATEKDILKIVKTNMCKIVITPIGGQGFLFGRGNHQLSHKVISTVGKENIIVLATEGKIRELKFQPFYVDTGDETVDNLMKGYIRVIIGYGQEMMYKIQ